MKTSSTRRKSPLSALTGAGKQKARTATGEAERAFCAHRTAGRRRFKPLRLGTRPACGVLSARTGRSRRDSEDWGGSDVQWSPQRVSTAFRSAPQKAGGHKHGSQIRRFPAPMSARHS